MLGGSQTVAGVVIFWQNTPMSKGDSVGRFDLHSHPISYNLMSEWFLWINGTRGTYQTPWFGGGDDATFSLGPKRSLDRVDFGQNSQR